MPADYWTQPAELHRKAVGMPLVPDAPLKGTTDKVADGILSEMLDRWGKLPSSERLQYVILVGGGALSDTAMEALSEQPQS